MFCLFKILNYICCEISGRYESLKSQLSSTYSPYEGREKSSFERFYLARYFQHRGLFVFSPEPDYIEAETKKKLDRRSLEITKIPGNDRNLSPRLSRFLNSIVPLQIRDAKFQSLLNYQSKKIC